MKPFVVYIDKSKVGKGKIVLEVEEFEKIIEEAYSEGYNDGLNKNISTPITPYPTWTPDPITHPPNWYKTTPDPNPWWNQPYCTTSSTKDNPDNVVTSIWNDEGTVPSSSVTHGSYTGDDSWITIDASDTKTVTSATWTSEDVLNSEKYYTASGEKITGNFNTVCIDNTKSSI